ncbi:GlxA family transcriptional regulator [Paracoccus aminophilus]|uniref:Transcriptional regulator, AraC family n=1 Tax=Paracoccus aminophilus JCM 7686 TaxID=1367847 RepID=S5Y7A3_PARAH|nr:helix-turn-helix domain-containing protein [Paracoccus aminophilus]AGT11410.1 transcriptional regulator, AraC family [Paracoccus aminophilus JCM 7686]
MTPNSPFHLSFLLFDGFSNMILACAMEPLRAARDLSGKRLFSWQIATMDGLPVVSSSRVSLSADLPADRIGATDALVVVTGYGARDHMSRSVTQFIRKTSRGLPLTVGLDTGAWLVAGAGLLTGRRATIHWMEVEAFAETFLDVETRTAPWEQDGNFVTCGGAGGVLDWALALIRDHGGEALSFDVANMFGRIAATSDRSHGTAAYPPDVPRMMDLGLPPALQRAITAMRQTADAPLSLPEIAEIAAVSLRTLDRMFMATLGVPAGGYYRQIRLAHARALAMDTRLTLAEIAARTGFVSAATLARAYRNQYGETVGASRARQPQRSHPFA